MFKRMVLGSLWGQRARMSIALLALTLGGALVSSLLNLSGDIGGQVGQELRAYGGNILVRPRQDVVATGSGALEFGEVAEARTLPDTMLSAIQEVEGVVGSVPYLYGVVEVGDQTAVLAGTDLAAARVVNTWWQIDGQWPGTEDDILVGARAAEVLALLPGNRFDIQYGDQTHTLRVSGILDTGGAEDDQLIGSLTMAQSLTGRQGQISLVLVSALSTGRPLNATVSELQRRLPDAEVQALAQFAGAEASVLSRVRLLLGLVAALVLISGALTVGGTLNTVVGERRAEIGLMKALGAPDRQVAGLFLVEALAVGGVGGLIGYLGGLALAALIEQRVFGTGMVLQPAALPATVLVALMVALLASLLPVRRALAVDPVITLRGE